MPKLKVLAGPEVVKILEKFGFVVASQKGSHVKLRRQVKDGTGQILTIPLHKELDRGTLRAILRQSSRYIPEADLAPYFYEQ
ncbi:type II toxin-antitoxin system HicA family toxin [Patescibacteria group bacterium]|nr:type II toxin-antitoxin system HicA family toxin [Patescibacteria group bacterium]